MEIIRLSEAGPELASAPFETNSRLTQIAMAERPGDFIADQVMPRVRSPFSFKYTKGTTEDQFTIPDTRASRAGRLEEVEFGATLADGSTDDHGLMAFVPERDIREAQAQGSGWDPMEEASQGIGQLMALDREKRVAETVFKLTNYPSTQRVTLAGNSQWSDKQNSNPVDTILAALDVPITRPNSLVFGQAAWTKFRTHPKVVESIKETGAGGVNAAGVVSRQAVADLFEAGAHPGRQRLVPEREARPERGLRPALGQARGAAHHPPPRRHPRPDAGLGLHRRGDAAAGDAVGGALARHRPRQPGGEDLGEHPGDRLLGLGRLLLPERGGMT